MCPPWPYDRRIPIYHLEPKYQVLLAEYLPEEYLDMFWVIKDYARKTGVSPISRKGIRIVRNKLRPGQVQRLISTIKMLKKKRFLNFTD